MPKHVKRICAKVAGGDQRGSTFVEVLIAIVILGLVAASVPPAIIFSTRAAFSQQENTIAQSLTRNQTEYIKSCSYISGNITFPYPSYAVVPVPDNTYEVTVTAQPINIDAVTLAHAPLNPGEDEGIQEITVEVRHVGRIILTSKSYKVNR